MNEVKVRPDSRIFATAFRVFLIGF